MALNLYFRSNIKKLSPPPLKYPLLPRKFYIFKIS